MSDEPMRDERLLETQDLKTIKTLADKFQRCVANGNITPILQVGCDCVFLRKNGLILTVRKERECAGR